ncbi:MAG: recombinase family protein [Lachnospiraceae bacterium]|nr:recombinase family protein [Lachnospiraceae bacterium]
MMDKKDVPEEEIEIIEDVTVNEDIDLSELYTAPLDEGKNSDWQERHNQREELRSHIRERVRSSNGDNEYFHKGKPAPDIKDDSHKTVAVYARVSTMNTAQTTSIENQEQYYTKKISENPNWDMLKIYSDEGRSGTDVKHRPAFLQMLEDAGNQEMDLILCTSVSRFARNTAQCLAYISKLRTMNPTHPVGVYFETENIYTLNPEAEQALQMHAMLADWESQNKSRRMILSLDQRICTGQYPVLDLLGYRHKDGKLYIHEEEAKTVKYVFIALILGISSTEIAKTLTEKERPSLKGNTDWSGSSIIGLTKNERRWGDLEARKTICIDYKEKVVIPNNEARDWAYVPGHHEGIVTPEMAKAAQFMKSSGGRLENGIPSLTVISEGALKGFVSVSPHWKGMDQKTYLDTCQSVYSDDELNELYRDIRIWSGEERPKVLSYTFAGYQVPPGIMFLNQGMPALTVTKKSVKFNRACRKKLDDCEWIEMFYHPIMQAVIIRKAPQDSQNAIRWITDKGNMVTQMESRTFSGILYDSLHWSEKYSFKFRGITKVRGDAKVIVFSLDEPLIHTGKREKARSGETIRYIPYTTDETGAVQEENDHDGLSEKAAAEKRIWMHAYLKAQREKKIGSITESDIRQQGKVKVNPLIGELPSRQELQEELNRLLMSM